MHYGLSIVAAVLATTGTVLMQPAAAQDTQRSYIESLFDQASLISQASGIDRDMDLAVALLTEAVRANHTGAMRQLAAIFLAGDGVPADPLRAEMLLLQAVQSGDIGGASYDLGELYRADTSLKDPARAVAAYEQSIATGNTAAMRRLAVMLYTGEGVPAEPTRAEALLQQAIAAGDVRDSAYELGEFYRADTPLRDPVRAAAAYEQAIAEGHIGAMRLLALMLYHDEGIDADPQRAELLLRQAIEAGDLIWAPNSLGDLYRADTPLRDLIKAADAYRQSADHGNPYAMIGLANLLTEGELPLDIDRAHSWLEAAFQAGAVADAGFALGRLLSREDYVHRDLRQAREYFDLAATAGSPYAHLVLVRLASAEFQYAEQLDRALLHAETAAVALGRDVVLDQLLQLPAESLIAIVQTALRHHDSSVSVTGTHAKSTTTAIARFCEQNAIADCDGRLVTRPFLDAVVLGEMTN